MFTSTIASKNSSVIVSSDAYFAIPALAKTNVEPGLVSRNLCEQLIEIGKIGYVAANAGHVVTDLLYSRRQFRVAPPGDVDVRAFVDEAPRRRHADATGTPGDECNPSVELSHVRLLLDQRVFAWSPRNTTHVDRAFASRLPF